MTSYSRQDTVVARGPATMPPQPPASVQLAAVELERDELRRIVEHQRVEIARLDATLRAARRGLL